MKNFFKVALLGFVGLMALVFLTAEKPTVIASEIDGMNLSSLPADYELVGQDKRVTKASLFKENSKTLVIVGNHDSLAVVKDLPKFFELKVPYVMVANISSAPWFVKKMFIPGKLEELNQGSKIPMIYDFDGDMVKALGVTNNAKTVFIAYVIDSKGTITKVYEGNVKEGALDGSMNEEEKKAALQPLTQSIN